MTKSVCLFFFFYRHSTCLLLQVTETVSVSITGIILSTTAGEKTVYLSITFYPSITPGDQDILPLLSENGDALESGGQTAH